MDAKADAPLNHATAADDSLVRGGPFFRLQRALGLIRPNQWNLGRRITFFVALAWLPMLVLTVLLNPKGLPSFLIEYRIYARLFLAIPALLIGEVLMATRFREVWAHIRQAELLDAPDLAYMNKVIATLVRVREALLPELAVLALLVVHTATSYRGLVDSTPWLGYGTGADFHLTAAGWYAVVVSAPLFQFFLGLSLWKWLQWTYFTFRLSQRHLKLVPAHPDQHAGLGFLGHTAAAFAPIAFAVSAVVGATWRNDILYHGARLMDFKLPAIALLVIVALIGLGPLAFFVPKLAVLRRKGIMEYALLGHIQSAAFHEKWILRRAGHEAEFLQAQESTTLNNYGQAFTRINQLKPFPADLNSLYTLAAAVAIPALPTVLAQIPLVVVLTDLLKALR